MMTSVDNRVRTGPLSPVRGFMCLLALLILVGCGNDSAPVRLQGKAIGTTYSIVAYGLPDGLDAQKMHQGVEQVVADVNVVMSLFKPDSELSRFNKYDGADWFPVSKELAGVVRTAKTISLLTGGAFDITVAPLVNLWGFGPEKRPNKIPTAGQIKNAQAEIGADFVEVRIDPPALRKLKQGISIDLAAIAKGYCVDAVSGWLKDKGVSDFMVEIGGEIRTAGTKPGDAPWLIGVEKPVAGGRSVQAVIELNGKAMATSGDYRNYFEADGKRYSHIIDPVIGKPISHNLVSVSVVEDSCTMADALVTGLMVLGPEQGINLAEKHKLSAFFIVRTEDGFAETATGDFPQHKAMK
ncbi:FAD:protein FMN transferase [Maridesulfovibrio sp.]|uniref:FAD:protein FMN transferase n=1 Tax=Maridesulfovibrio sp. TaxID=2795000 RepID=UPI003BA9AD92